MLYYISLTKRIQFRLAAILCTLPGRPKRKQRPKRKEVTPPWHTIATNHTPYENGRRVCCSRCRSGFAIKDPSLNLWLQSSCTAIGSSTDKPIPLTYEQVHIGNSNTHNSHQLYKYRGLIYCNKCVCKSRGAKLVNLSRLCLPPAPTYGKPALKALQQGMKPPGLTKWPDSVLVIIVIIWGWILFTSFVGV